MADKLTKKEQHEEWIGDILEDLFKDTPPIAFEYSDPYMSQGGVTGFMCKSDYEFELGQNQHGIEVYRSIEDLKKDRKCIEECGIVEVKVSMVKVIQKSNFNASKDRRRTD